MRRLLAALPLLLCAPPATAERLPPENQCPTIGGLPGAAASEDAVPLQLREGMVLTHGDLLTLARLIPSEIWRHRQQFFHEGMRMEIGPCHRRYPVASFYRIATERFRGRARVDRDGNLHDYVAGLPFDPEGTPPDAEEAGIRWAWNLEQRYRGAGPVGSFRIVDMPSRVGSELVYTGTYYFLKTRHRADLEQSKYTLPNAKKNLWIAGGRFLEPFDARHLAWQQFRPSEVLHDFDEPDDVFVYVPTMRKVRRSATTWTDGMFTPRYTAAGDAGGGGIAFGTGDGIGLGAINPTSALSAAQTEDIRRGFAAMAIRPNAYVWRVATEREVLAPLNATRSGYPNARDRNFGPSGLSFGSDRWEVRYAVVLQGTPRERGHGFEMITIYVDFQTQQPLYMIKRRGRGRITQVGILVHRFSGDVIAYPEWPGGIPPNVFDPVGETFYDVLSGGAGWRRESYDIRSVPLDGADLERRTSSDALGRGR